MLFPLYPDSYDTWGEGVYVKRRTLRLRFSSSNVSEKGLESLAQNPKPLDSRAGGACQGMAYYFSAALQVLHKPGSSVPGKGDWTCP